MNNKLTFLLALIVLLVPTTTIASDNWFKRAVQTAWGEPSYNNIYLGLWSYHFSEPEDTDYQSQNNLLGITYKGLYLGTFINSHDNRSWSVGIQRDIFRKKWDNDIEFTTGYRAGAMTGYDKRDIVDSGIGPVVQWLADVSYKQRFGVQFSYAVYVLTGGFFVRYSWE